MPTITVIEHVRDLPAGKLRGYSLGDSYSEVEAVRDYQAVYKTEPTTGYKWGSYLYLVLPE